MWYTKVDVSRSLFDLSYYVYNIIRKYSFEVVTKMTWLYFIYNYTACVLIERSSPFILNWYFWKNKNTHLYRIIFIRKKNVSTHQELWCVIYQIWAIRWKDIDWFLAAFSKIRYFLDKVIFGLLSIFLHACMHTYLHT